MVQADRFADLAAVTVLPITGTLLDALLPWVEVEPNAQNGLTKRSHIMVDKPQTPPRSTLGAVFGHLDDATMLAVNRALPVFFSLA